MNTENNKKILDLMYTSIMSEGGDGDAVWLSKHTSLKDIVTLIKEYNTENNTNWEITEEENLITWGIDQEFAFITDDEQTFLDLPKWIVLKINY